MNTKILPLLFFAASFIAIGSIHTETAYADFCPGGGDISYHDAVDQVNGGSIQVVKSPDLGANRVTVTVTNNSGCSIPVSLGSYKLFAPYDPAHLSEQEFFDGSATVVVAASTTQTLSVALPTCMAQYDLWYGPVLHQLIDNRVYGEFLAGDQVRIGLDNVCVHPTPPPVIIPPTETTTPPVATTTPPEATTTPPVATTTPPVATTTPPVATTTPPVATTTPPVATTTPPVSPTTTETTLIPPETPPVVTGGGGSGPVGSNTSGGPLGGWSGGGTSIPLLASAYAAPIVQETFIPGLPNAGIGPLEHRSLWQTLLMWLDM